MRLRTWLTVTVACCAAVIPAACSGATTGGDAACAAPYLQVEPATAAPGDEVTVTGSGMIHGCADTGENQFGDQEVEHSEPMSGIEIRLVLDDSPSTLATVDADGDGEFTVAVTVPAKAPAGPAAIGVNVRFAEEASLEIVR